MTRSIECPQCKIDLDFGWDDVGHTHVCDCGCSFYLASDEDADCEYWFEAKDVNYTQRRPIMTLPRAGEAGMNADPREAHNTDVIGKDRAKGKDEANQKVLIAYHANCIDGFTSAWACWRGLLDTTSILNSNIDSQEVTYADLTDIKNRARDYDKIYFVDFSIPVKDIATLAATCEVVIIDHHKSAFEMYENELIEAEFIFDVSECGASLVWKHFFPTTPLPYLIRIVRDYDLWQFTHDHTKELQMYLRLQPKLFTNWQYMQEVFEGRGKLSTAASLGKVMQRYHDFIVTQLLDQAEICWLDGIKGLCVNCSSQFANDVGNALVETSDTYGATWQQRPGGAVKWSLRSNGQEDVSAIAASFGGGGHKDAAGFYLASPSEDVTRLGVTLWSRE